MTSGQSSRASYGPLGSSVYVPPSVNLGKEGREVPWFRVDTPSAFLATYRTLRVMRLLKCGGSRQPRHGLELCFARPIADLNRR
ncbi:hypothetical protein SSPNP10_24970 [Streptomyces sp. NP10]|nr:hypothetical protein SSPNP10_24970 [Streptomyces sp. NP10]